MVNAYPVEKIGWTHSPGVEQYISEIIKNAKAACHKGETKKGSTQVTNTHPTTVPTGRVIILWVHSSKLGCNNKNACIGSQYI